MLKGVLSRILGKGVLQLLVGLVKLAAQIIGENVVVLLLSGFGPVEYQFHH